MMADENPSRLALDADRASPSEPPRLENTDRRGPAVYRSSKRRRNILILLVLLAVAVGGVLFWRHLSTYESTDDAQVDVHLYPVSARISGYVSRVNVGDNQYVEKGTVLVEIDPKDYEVAVAQALSNLASTEATAQSLNIAVPITSVSTASQLKFATSDVETSNAGIIAAQKQVAAAHAQLEQAEANDVKVQDDVHRYKSLVDKQEVSAQVYDQAVAAARASTASIAAARANEAAAEQVVQQARSRLVGSEANAQSAGTAPQQVSSTRNRARAALAEVEQRRAALEQARLNLQYTDQRGSEQVGRCRNECWTGPGIAYRRASRRCLDHRQFQGNAAQAHASRTKGGNSCRFKWADLQRSRRQYRWGHGSAVQPASTRERHG